MIKTIYIAGGCFWGVERYFQQIKGITNTKVGYANGNIVNPKYEDLKSHIATHSETVKIEYDNEIINLEAILNHFLRFVDPYSIDKQGEDYGHQYRSGVYFVDNDDQKVINDYFNNHLKPDYKIEVLPLANFYLAEDYHQDYLIKNPNGYCHINFNLIKEEEK